MGGGYGGIHFGFAAQQHLRAHGARGRVEDIGTARAAASMALAADNGTNGVEDSRDLRLFDDERRGERQDVAGVAHQHATLQAFQEDFVSARADGAGARFQFDAGHEAQVSDVLHMRRALDRMRGCFERRRQRTRALEQPFATIQVQRGHRRGRGQRVGRIRIAVEQLNRAWRAGIDDGVVHRLAHGHGAHRHGGVVDALGHRQQVRRHAKELGRRCRAQAAKTGDDFIEDQQDAVLVAQRAQTLQVALGRHQHARGTRQRLDDDGGDG
ncbi:hypothetical protein DL770_011107 [Monosporascus sp. CRB-9-2]|nr:hypothetical protein DL770_011107 [Monosporascus sp. CRB-9-2]